MLDLTMCVAVTRSGRDCTGPIVVDCPVPICVVHLREAYLFYADYLANMTVISEADRADAERMPMPFFHAKQDTHPGFVYYVRIGDHVKIGTTRDMSTRMATLMPDQILASELGGRDVERARHEQFKASRAPKGREYFNPGHQLMAHIAALAAAGDPPSARSEPSAGLVVGVLCPTCDQYGLFRRQAGGDATCGSCGTIVPAGRLAGR